MMKRPGTPPAPVRLLAIGSLFFLYILAALPVLTDETLIITEDLLHTMEQRYGTEARQRLLDWQDLLRRAKQDDEMGKIEKINRFFNTMAFIDDRTHWQADDYWATPVEFLASKGGDCEDFAIAKYFSLVTLGVDENKLTLTYVKALRLNQAHMVLSYYPSPQAEPLILDSLIDAIKPSSQRTDLQPVYSLNGSGLWLAKQRGRGKMVGDTSRLSRWQDLLARMTDELHRKEEKP